MGNVESYPGLVRARSMNVADNAPNSSPNSSPNPSPNPSLDSQNGFKTIRENDPSNNLEAITQAKKIEWLESYNEYVKSDEPSSNAHADVGGIGEPVFNSGTQVNSDDLASLRQVTIRSVEVLRESRPGLLDVISEIDGRLAHQLIGLRGVGDETHFFRPGEDGVLGLFEDKEGLVVAVDALKDVQLAGLLLESLFGDQVTSAPATVFSDSEDSDVLTFGNDFTFSIFPWLLEKPHPGVELLVALDEAGFNHLAAPIALWRRGGSDLGIVQEVLAGMAGGWALALTSLRDLYASGDEPEVAGGDFASEAQALGMMTARMHLAMDKAFGRQTIEIRSCVDSIEKSVREKNPSLLQDPDVSKAFSKLRSARLQLPILRTHGDLHLGRTARTDQGWVVTDFAPGGLDPDASGVELRSPLADVADMVWSFHYVASVAATERDPTGRLELNELAKAWELRNRRSFLSGYMAAPGIGGLVLRDRELVRNLVAIFELERFARKSSTR